MGVFISSNFIDLPLFSSSIFLLRLGVWVPCPWVLSVCFSIWASNVLTFRILGSGHPLLGMMIYQVGETLCSVRMSALSAGGFFPWRGLFCLRMALTVFCSFNPMASRLSEMAMCVRHTSSILAVVAVRSRASSFLMSSLSLRALTNLYWTFRSFLSSVGKLHRSARARRRSTSSSGDSPGQMRTSSSW